MTVLAGLAFARGMSWLKENRRSWQPAALALFGLGLLLSLGEMIRLHPYQYTHFNHIAGTVRGADDRYMLDYWGLAFKQASDSLREQLDERHVTPPPGHKGNVAVCGPHRGGAAPTWPRFHHWLGQPRRRLRDDARRILLQGPDQRANHG